MVSSILPLELMDCTVTHGDARLLGPVSCRLDVGGVTIILGPNGAGKTTLLRLMHGLERPASGRLRWAVPKRDSFAHQSFVFQSPVMLRRSVRENLEYPLRLRRQADASRVDDWLDRTALTARANLPARSLSRGERQKLALARALITDPQVLFLDEPCASLDGAATRQIETILTDAASAGTRIVMSTHDLGQARRLGRDVLFLYRGTIIEAGPAVPFFDKPETEQAAAFLRGEIVE